MEVKGGNEVRFRKGRWLDFNLKEVMLGKAAKKKPFEWAFTTWGPSGLSSKSLLKGDFIFLQPSLRLGQVRLG